MNVNEYATTSSVMLLITKCMEVIETQTKRIEELETRVSSIEVRECGCTCEKCIKKEGKQNG